MSLEKQLHARLRKTFPEAVVAKERFESVINVGSEIYEGGMANWLDQQMSGFSWDENAEVAWTDSTIYTECMEDSVPDYVPLPDE